MDFINVFIAQILDKFKTTSPKIFAIVVIVILGANEILDILLDTGLDSGVITEMTAEIIKKVKGWVVMAIAFLTNSSTFKFKSLDETKKVK